MLRPFIVKVSVSVYCLALNTWHLIVFQKLYKTPMYLQYSYYNLVISNLIFIIFTNL